MAGIAFWLVALIKIDFAVAGTCLLGIALIAGKERDRRIWLLPVYALVALILIHLTIRIAIRSEDLIYFSARWRGIYHWDTKSQLLPSWVTLLYACGVGTVALGLAALLFGAAKRAKRVSVLRIAVAWGVGVMPLWIFWLAHAPMSARYDLPGVVVTGLLATLIASHAFKRIKFAPVLWLVALISINWAFGKPNLDFNYSPSGNLWGTLSSCRKAASVRDDIAAAIVDRRERIKVVLGPRRKDVLDGIDFVPSIEVLLASRSQSVHAIESGWELVFTGSDGLETILLPYLSAERALQLRSGRWQLWRQRPQPLREAVGYYSPWGVDACSLEAHGIEVTSFDPDRMFEMKAR